jgi:hypothetical protein
MVGYTDLLACVTKYCMGLILYLSWGERNKRRTKEAGDSRETEGSWISKTQH